MTPIRLILSRPVSVAVAVILVVMFGLIGLGAIPKQLTPQVDQPIITVTTNWEGRSPQEIVDEITKEQEEFLKSVAGLKSMRSDSTQGQSTITLEFFIGTDIDRARQEVSDALRRVPDYPENVDEPVIATTEGAAMNAIAWIILDVKPSERHKHPDFDISTLQDAIDRDVKPYLERIDGVAQINVFGGREREVRVLVDPHALAQRGINPVVFVNALRAQNRNVTGGTIDEGKREYRVRVLGQYTTIQEVLDTVVAYRDGRPVYVGDVAEAEISHQKKRAFVRSLSAPCIAINAMRKTGANVVDVMADMRDRLEIARKEIIPSLDPVVGPDLRLRQVYDETVYIHSSINLVRLNLVFGGILAALILLLFLRSFISTGVIVLAIPISVIGTFLVLLATGRTLNVISLAGLAFAVGMVVDNAIVVLENINRKLHDGQTPMLAAETATNEVWGAIVASTLTTAAVFIPILTIQEEAGQIFRDISLAIVAAVLLSLIVSITVIPTACSRWLRDVDHDNDSRIHLAFFNLFGLAPRAAHAARSIGNLVRWTSTGWRGPTVRPATIILLTVISLLGAKLLAPPLDYLPKGNQNLVFGGLVIPPGQSVEQMERIASRIEKVVQPYAEISINDPDYADKVDPIRRPFTNQFYKPVPIENFFIAGFGGSIFAGATSQNPDVVLPLGALLTNPMMAAPDSVGGAAQASIFGRGVGGGSTIDLEIAGPNLDKVRAAAQMMFDTAMKMEGLGPGSLRTSPPNFNLEQPEWRITLNRRAKELGLNTTDFGVAVRALFDGAFVGDFQLDGDPVDLVVLPKGTDPTRPARLAYKEQLASLPIATPRGPVVPLDQIVDVNITGAPQAIRRIEELPGITISIEPPADQPLEDTMRQIREQIIAPAEAAGRIDSAMRVRLEGTAAELDEVRAALFGPPPDRNAPTTMPQHAAHFGALAIVVVGLIVGIRAGIRARRKPSLAYGAAGAIILAVILAGLLMGVADNPDLITARFVWALVVTYLLMAALFESFILPFVIMFSVPLAIVGGFAGLAIVHAWTMADPTKQPQQLDVLTMLGFVILIGVVVNNAILIVHQSLNFMNDADKPMHHNDAIAESVRTRVRPIFMSTLTSVGGMLPLVLFPGAGSEMYRGLGSVVIGGLLVSTIFTLVLVPLLLSLVLDMRNALRPARPGQHQAEPKSAGDRAAPTHALSSAGSP